MRNLTPLYYSEVEAGHVLHPSSSDLPSNSGGDDSDDGAGRCELAEDLQGNLLLACGRVLWRLSAAGEGKCGTGGGLQTPSSHGDGAESVTWLRVGQLFDLDGDEVVSLQATFRCFCAISKRGQIVTFQLETLPSVETVGDIFGGVSSVAWAPDLELFVVLTCSGRMLLMREDFDTVAEHELETTELGERSAITVGWGKKETQFHGSEGKKAARVSPLERKPLADADDRRSFVVWRHDGQFFATNSAHNDARTIRIWSRDGILQNTAETVAELHGGLAWWWGDENLITTVDTCSQKGERRIIFYETNGFRHGQFVLPSTSLWVKDIHQATLGAVRVMSVLCRDQTEDVLLVYTMNNYHWYPKQTLRFPAQVRAHLWGTQDTLRVFTSDTLYSYRWAFQVDADGLGRVAVIDGCRVLLTDLSRYVIPPPMAQRTIIATRHVNSVVLLPSSEVLLQLDDGSLVLGNTGDTIAECPKEFGTLWSHLTAFSTDQLIAVVCKGSLYKLVLVELRPAAIRELVSLPGSPECLCVFNKTVRVKLDREIFSYNIEDGSSSVESTEMGVLEKLQCTSGGDLVGFNSTERCLYFKEVQLCNKASSYVIHGDTFILATTVDNTLECYPIFASTSACCDVRKLEIGSLLVTSVPADGRVILQMPRGNIETIYPRPLMLHAIHSHLAKDEFDEAFRLMKVNRINMNLLYDYSPNTFVAKVEIMIRKINNVSHINLMVMELSQEDVTKSMYKGYYDLIERPKQSIKKDVLAICDAVREALIRVDELTYLLSVITCNAKKNTEDDLEAALLTINRFPARFDESVKYLTLLVDVSRLMDIALGTYDFKIFLKVAQLSQKDPKEYLALLNELKAYEDEDYRRFKIEMHLRRYDRALVHISKCSNHFPECLDLVIRERMFTKARNVFPHGSNEARALWAAHGDYLLTKKHYKDAAIAYMQAELYQKASQCFERALCVDLCLKAAQMASVSVEPIVKRLLVALKADRKCTEAGQLMKRFHFPADEVCLTLVEGGCWEEAFCVLPEVSDSNRRDCIERQLREQMLSSAHDLQESVSSLAMKFSGHVSRLRLVREQKASRSDDFVNFYDDTDLPMSEAGSMISGISRGRSIRSGTTRSGSVTTMQSNRQTRRNRKPKYTLKEGSPFEDLAIIQECIQLVGYIPGLVEQIVPLITGLQLVSLMDEAASLQTKFYEFFTAVRDSHLPEVWPDTSDEASELIGDEELRKKPTLPDVAHASALFANRW